MSFSMLMIWLNNAWTERKMQEAVDRVSQACDNYDLTISTQKTVYRPAPGKPHDEPTITVNWHRLQVVINSSISEALCQEQCILMKVNARLAKARWALSSLHGNAWDRSGISLNTKLKVYKPAVLSFLLYIWGLDSIPTPYQKTEPLPHKLGKRL